MDSDLGAAQPTSNFRIVGAVEPLWTRTGQLRHVAEERLGCQAALASTPEEATVFVGRYLATDAGRGWRLAPSTAAERCEEQRFLRPVDAAIAACADFWGLPIRERAKIVIEALDRLEPRADDGPLPALTAEEEAAEAAREDADRIAVAAHLERERAASEAFERRETALFEEDRRIEEARAIWHETVPGAGTLTERYITDIRGMLGLPEGWSVSCAGTRSARLWCCLGPTPSVSCDSFIRFSSIAMAAISCCRSINTADARRKNSPRE